MAVILGSAQKESWICFYSLYSDVPEKIIIFLIAWKFEPTLFFEHMKPDYHHKLLYPSICESLDMHGPLGHKSRAQVAMAAIAPCLLEV